MGYNSYTQTLCIDRAVTYNAHMTKTTANISQVSRITNRWQNLPISDLNISREASTNPQCSKTVTYSSKLVQHLSQIATSLNVSHSASIKKGTVEVAGNSNAINEEKVRQSDINAVVTVNVSARFLLIH